MSNFALTPEDFPLIAVGPLVYRRTMSSPIVTAPNDWLAADIASRLNRDWMAQSGIGASSGGFIASSQEPSDAN